MQAIGLSGKNWANNWNANSALRAEILTSDARPSYVAWIDLMGARGWMAGSIRRAAEMIGLIHVAGLHAVTGYQKSLKVYPVIDGVYVVSESKADFRRATADIMRTLALTFLHRKNEDRFLVRGGIAYGRLLHGTDIADLHPDLKDDHPYHRCLAVGISIGQAYAAEGKSPPFGFYVDTTARSTASLKSVPYTSSFYRWWKVRDAQESKIACDFGSELDKHFAYLESKRRELEYPIERLNEHRALAWEYFGSKKHELAQSATAKA